MCWCTTYARWSGLAIGSHYTSNALQIYIALFSMVTILQEHYTTQTPRIHISEITNMEVNS